MTQADVGERGIVLRTSSDVLTLANEIVRSGMCPKAYAGKPHDAMIAMLAGRAVGLEPLQSLAGIAVIGGRPSMFGDARAAVVLGSGLVEWVHEWFALDGQEVQPQYASLKDYPAGLTACWQAKRKDQSEPTPVVRFCVGDAKVAGLWAKAGPWSQYPPRMLRMRARAWGERDHFADALHGIQQAEEMADIERPKPKWEQAVEGQVVEPPALDAPQAPAPETVDAEPPEDGPATQAAKGDLLAAVKRHIEASGEAEPMPATKLIVAVLKAVCGTDHAERLSELDAVWAAIKGGEFDLASGQRIPPAGDPL